MKRQQVISRFFAPKASAPPSSPNSTQIAPTSSSPKTSPGNGPPRSSSTVLWPPRGGSSASGSLNQDFSFSPAKKRARKEDELPHEQVVAEDETPLPGWCSSHIPSCNQFAGDQFRRTGCLCNQVVVISLLCSRDESFPGLWIYIPSCPQNKVQMDRLH